MCITRNFLTIIERMEISDWISVGSFVISSFAAVWAYIANRKCRKNTERLQEIELAEHKKIDEERKKALIEASTVKAGGRCEIIFHNIGLATARNIRVWAEFMEDSSHKDGISTFPLDGLLPYPLLHSGGSFGIKLILWEGHKSAPIVQITWDDDFGNDNQREVIVNL